MGNDSNNTVYEMEFRRKDASTQTVHLTVPMLTEMAPETGKTMFGSKKKTHRLRSRCLFVNISEGDLTSDEKSPWKQLFLCIPFEQARRIIGPGITKFTFHLKHDFQWFEISCLDGTQWCVAQHYAVPKRNANDNEAYTWHEFLEYFGETRASAEWQNSEPQENTKLVCFTRTSDDQMVTCRLSRPTVTPMCPGYPPRPDPNPGAVQAPRVVMVGLSGPSSVGKSALAQGLATKLASPVCPIEAKMFTKKRLPTTQDGCFNSETPASIDFDSLCKCLDKIKEALLKGPKVKTLFKIKEALLIVVAEGFYLPCDKNVWERLDFHWYVDGDSGTYLERLFCAVQRAVQHGLVLQNACSFPPMC